MQTVTGLAHYDRDARHSYEEIFAIMRKIGLQQIEQITYFVSSWKQFAKGGGVRKEYIQAIDKTLLYSVL